MRDLQDVPPGFLLPCRRKRRQTQHYEHGLVFCDVADRLVNGDLQELLGDSVVGRVTVRLDVFLVLSGSKERSGSAHSLMRQLGFVLGGLERTDRAWSGGEIPKLEIERGAVRYREPGIHRSPR